jgi:hypothetical protein
MSDKAPCLPLVVALSWLGLSGAWAQTNQALPPAPPEVQGEPLDEPPAADGAGSLSEKLEHAEGVITPPASGTDPGIVQPTPDTGESKIPVIPPPGTPGGDPNVRPQ